MVPKKVQKLVPKKVQNWSENGPKKGPKISLRVAAPSPQKVKLRRLHFIFAGEGAVTRRLSKIKSSPKNSPIVQWSSPYFILRRAKQNTDKTKR